MTEQQREGLGNRRSDGRQHSRGQRGDSRQVSLGRLHVSRLPIPDMGVSGRTTKCLNVNLAQGDPGASGRSGSRRDGAGRGDGQRQRSSRTGGGPRVPGPQQGRERRPLQPQQQRLTPLKPQQPSAAGPDGPAATMAAVQEVALPHAAPPLPRSPGAAGGTSWALLVSGGNMAEQQQEALPSEARPGQLVVVQSSNSNLVTEDGVGHAPGAAAAAEQPAATAEPSGEVPGARQMPPLAPPLKVPKVTAAAAARPKQNGSADSSAPQAAHPTGPRSWASLLTVPAAGQQASVAARERKQQQQQAGEQRGSRRREQRVTTPKQAVDLSSTAQQQLASLSLSTEADAAAAEQPPAPPLTTAAPAPDHAPAAAHAALFPTAQAEQLQRSREAAAPTAAPAPAPPTASPVADEVVAGAEDQPSAPSPRGKAFSFNRGNGVILMHAQHAQHAQQRTSAGPPMSAHPPGQQAKHRCMHTSISPLLLCVHGRTCHPFSNSN
jgi:hypothetical protein